MSQDVVAMNTIVQNARAECMRGTRRVLRLPWTPPTYYWTPPEKYRAKSLEDAETSLGIRPSEKRGTTRYGQLKCEHVKKGAANLLLVTFTCQGDSCPDGKQLVESWDLMKVTKRNTDENGDALPLDLRVVPVDSESEKAHHYHCVMSFMICWDDHDIQWSAQGIENDKIRFIDGSRKELTARLRLSRLGIPRSDPVEFEMPTTEKADKKLVFVLCKLTDGVRDFAEGLNGDEIPYFSWCQFNTDVDIDKDFSYWNEKPKSQDVQGSLIKWNVFRQHQYNTFVPGSNFIGACTDAFNSTATFQYVNECLKHVNWPAIPPYRFVSAKEPMGGKFIMDRLYVMLWYDKRNETSLFKNYISDVFQDGSGDAIMNDFITDAMHSIWKKVSSGEKRLKSDSINKVPTEDDIQDVHEDNIDNVGIVNGFVVSKYLNNDFKATKTPEDFKDLILSIAKHIKEHHSERVSLLVQEAITFVESNDADKVLRYTGTCSILGALHMKDFRDDKPATAYRVDNILKCTFTNSNIKKPDLAATDACAAMALIVKSKGNEADNMLSMQKGSAYFVPSDKTVPQNVNVEEYSSVNMLRHCHHLLMLPKIRQDSVSVITDLESDDLGALSVLASHFRRVIVYICTRNKSDTAFFEAAKTFLKHNKPDHVEISDEAVECCDRCPSMKILQDHYKVLLGPVLEMATETFPLKQEQP